MFKHSIDDRIRKESRAINMLQGALSTNGNINVDIAITLFKKQIIPILTYSSIYWGMSDCFNKIYVSDIPKNVSTLENSAKQYKYIQFNSILYYPYKNT